MEELQVAKEKQSRKSLMYAELRMMRRRKRRGFVQKPKFNSVLLSSCRSQLEAEVREVLVFIPFATITINPNSASPPLLPLPYNLTDYISAFTLNLGIASWVRSMEKEINDEKRRSRKAEGKYQKELCPGSQACLTLATPWTAAHEASLSFTIP